MQALILAAILSATALLQGCADTGVVKLGTSDPCATLKDVIAAYPNGFQDFRGASNKYSYVTIYQAKQQIIANHCEIWEWSAGSSAYVCNIPAPDAASGRERYQNALSKVQACLGLDWTATTQDRFKNKQFKGVATHLRRDNAAPLISVHALENDGAFQNQSTTYIYVGAADKVPQ